VTVLAETRVVQGRRIRAVRYVLTRQRWQAHRRLAVEISGLEPVRRLLGVDAGGLGFAATAARP
jgi:hypothetical protein